MHAPTLNQLEGRNGQEVAQLTDDMANFKLTGTDADMEYYEKRYQQRVSFRYVIKWRPVGLHSPSNCEPYIDGHSQNV